MSMLGLRPLRPRSTPTEKSRFLQTWSSSFEPAVRPVLPSLPNPLVSRPHISTACPTYEHSPAPIHTQGENRAALFQGRLSPDDFLSENCCHVQDLGASPVD